MAPQSFFVFYPRNFSFLARAFKNLYLRSLIVGDFLLVITFYSPSYLGQETASYSSQDAACLPHTVEASRGIPKFYQVTSFFYIYLF